jgi:uncharacterized protein (TIGR00725 family)
MSSSSAAVPAAWPPVIAIAGASKPTAYQLKAAFTAGQLLARRKAIVVCGGLAGVMDAAARGVATVDKSISVGLLPGLDIASSSPAITIPITTGLGEVRNVVLVQACRAMIAIGGGYGTLSEIGFALRLRRPLALIDSWEFNHASMATDPDPPHLFTAPRPVGHSASDAEREAHAVRSATAAVDWILDQLGGEDA